MPKGQSHVRGDILVLKLESAGLKEVDIKANTTSQLYGASLCIMQYVMYNTDMVHTSTYWYILVCAGMCWYVLVCTPIDGHITERCIVVKWRLFMTSRDGYRRPVSLGKL